MPQKVGEQYDVDDVEEKTRNVKVDTVPKGQRRNFKREAGDEIEKVVLKFRACNSCKIILSEQQFYDSGCPNCPNLEMDRDRHAVLTSTSANFTGMIAVMKPRDSWVAKYNKLTATVPGCYALSVVGEIPFL
ncbi:transcription elongation factor SPT4 [Cardiosporidium cionae]|uniref:Transcription elongation factor SPT4 n=1 Tax=Cardiosporidium cionae TaxID=476202 RepID=A0ABQ7JH12_9APIC|nr:transcription elongation factor SPT4 [Cardiosporidium cionae]|eukprot:KAF8823030.1 transcription elongation factor SPT4 [Cardiosporidium cionae]